MKRKVNRKVEKQDSREENLSRRKAIKRLAIIFAGAALGTTALGKGRAFAWDTPPHDPYADSVYGSKDPSHDRYMSYYASTYNRYSSVPSPYVP
ncbi:MAG: hypothetical protein V3U54_02970 [Thermodesulfobacteriota bacterium]